MLSKRGTTLLDHSAKVQSNCLQPGDEYNAQTNPEGFIDLSLSLQSVCDDVLEKRLTRAGSVQFSSHVQHYPPDEGTKQLRNSIANFLTRQFKVKHPLSADNVVITNGATGAFDMLSYSLADPGDVFLLVSPNYAGIRNPFQRSEVIITILPRTSKYGWILTAKMVEDSVQKIEETGKKVKAFVLVSPDNPIGDLFTVDGLLEILDVCKRYEIHAIFDEVYGSSIFEESAEFVSILSLENIPDPNRTHLIWGVSKNFGLGGARIGALYITNPSLLLTCKKLSYYSMAPAIVQEMIANFLDDKDWLEQVYFPTMLSRLKELYSWSCKRFAELGVPVHAGCAGIFLWLDFRKFLKENTIEAELELFSNMMKSTRVKLTPGTQMWCEEPGWSRIIFSMKKELLTIAYSRIEKFLSTIRTSTHAETLPQI